jgi:hypothetical protein
LYVWAYVHDPGEQLVIQNNLVNTPNAAKSGSGPERWGGREGERGSRWTIVVSKVVIQIAAGGRRKNVYQFPVSSSSAAAILKFL